MVLRLFNDLHGDSTTYEKIAIRAALDGQPRAAVPRILGGKAVLVTKGLRRSYLPDIMSQ